MVSKTKILVSLLAGAALLTSALPPELAAKGPANVAGTIHNFSSTARDATGNESQYQSNQTEICVFCHTPHGGSLTGPLWNRANPTSSWQHYESQTLGTYLGGLANNRALSDESLMCMSCHDGSLTPAINHLINPPNAGPSPVKSETGDDMEIIAYPGNNKIGGTQADPWQFGNLTDDHPISFSYDEVLNNPPYSGGGPKAGQLRPLLDATTAGVRFFGATNRVECSTCHDPHVEYDYASNNDYAPFLIMPNTGSNLCLACHNK